MSEKYIARSPAVAARRFAEEMIVMSSADSTLFNLSEVAAVIWEAADGHTPLSEIVRDQVCAVFDVPPDEAYRDAEAFVEDLARHGILQVSASPIQAGGSAAGEGA
jgi:Coenzyme PQQ synthesis protein D (PqqD)